jgi:hypothetical protein
LISLLHNRAPVWGLAPASCDLASALGSVGHHFGYEHILFQQLMFCDETEG